MEWLLHAYLLPEWAWLQDYTRVIFLCTTFQKIRPQTESSKIVRFIHALKIDLNVGEVKGGDEERSRAMGQVLGGIATGVLLGQVIYFLCFPTVVAQHCLFAALKEICFLSHRQFLISKFETQLNP